MGIICHLYVHISILYTLCVYVCVCVCVGACVGVHRSLHGNNNTIVFYDWWWVSCCSFSFKTDRADAERQIDEQTCRLTKGGDRRTDKQTAGHMQTNKRTHWPLFSLLLSAFSVCLSLSLFLFISLSYSLKTHTEVHTEQRTDSPRQMVLQGRHHPRSISRYNRRILLFLYSVVFAVFLSSYP